MEKGELLLTAFENTSSELLLRNASEYKTIILPNDKLKDSEIVIDYISKNKYDYVFCFGQKPVLKNKITIEIVGKEDDIYIYTTFEYDELKLLFQGNGIITNLSYNAGTSFCNKLYYNSMKYVIENRLKTKVIFIHIPTNKNIIDAEVFPKIIDLIAKYRT
ncbi:MAG: hypothetical protein RR444_10430 [Oscillospiraceae bacterium]